MHLAVVGGGPAGLRAAEVASRQGVTVRLFDAKASTGRKFLIAGKGGLNLTHSEPIDQFSTRYTSSASDCFWSSILTDFSNDDLRAWAASLGIETFIGTSGRVFPSEFKAAPLLRRWLERLRSQGVTFQMNHQLTGINKQDDRFILEFKTSSQTITHTCDAVLLALGGASWPETGSDGKWTSLLCSMGICVEPMSPANCGWEVSWPSDLLSEIEGIPLKNITITAGNKTIAGELLITRYGLEGGGLYQLGSTLRFMPVPSLLIDLKPTFSAQQLADKITFSGQYPLNQIIKKWRLSHVAATLLKNFSHPDSFIDSLALAHAAKSLRIPLVAPRPIAEAISSAGGVRFSELDDSLMMKQLPGLFVAGEMLDWEAPTGGYLLQGCFATGTRAAQGVCKFLNNLGNTD